jgi:4-amino-4-deoxy-L-arabinose transferase-like glycosyltransferase
MNIRALRDLHTGLVWLAAALLLAAMFLLLLGSVREDSLTADEPAHITAGYAYLRFRDGQFNPEHPPLLKILAAAPLLPLPLHFPLDHPAWQDGPNGLWDLMGVFLFESGHDLHRIAALARLASIGLTVTLGLVLFLWARRWAGDSTALLALCLYALSPTVLAHGRYITTDVPGTLGVALAGDSFSRLLAAPSRPAMRQCPPYLPRVSGLLQWSGRGTSRRGTLCGGFQPRLGARFTATTRLCGCSADRQDRGCLLRRQLSPL